MAYVYKDRIKEPSTSTGTGAIVGSGTATPKFLPLSTIGNTNTFAYTIEHDTLTEWEVGIGTYTTASNSFTRDLVLASSNANALVTFSAGNKTVFNTLPAARIHPPLANTQIGVGDSNSVLAGSGELVYDSIGLRHIKAQNATDQIAIVNTDPGAAAEMRFNCANGTSNLWLSKTGINYTASGLVAGNQGWVYNTQGSLLYVTSTDHIWAIAGTAAANEKMRLLANGNWSLSGTSGATPEVSYTTDATMARMVVQKNATSITDIGAVNTNTGATSYGQVYCGNGSSYLIMIKTSTGYTAQGLQGPGMGVIGNTAGALLTYNSAAADFIWSTPGVTATNERMRLSSNSILTITNPVTTAYAGTTISNGVGIVVSWKWGTAWVANNLQQPNGFYQENTTGNWTSVNSTLNDFIWARGGWQNANEALRLSGSRLSFIDTSGNTATQTDIGIQNSGGNLYLTKAGSTYVTNGVIAATDTYTYNASGKQIWINVAGADMVWTIGGFGTAQEAMRLKPASLTVNGLPMMRYRGAWQAVIAYFVGDVVFYGGNNYICIVQQSGVGPTNASYWTLTTNNHGRPQLADGATVTWDVAAAPVAWVYFTAAVGGNRTISITNALAGQTYALQISADSVPSRVLSWSSNVHWPNGNRAPVCTNTAGYLDLFTFVALDPTFLAGAYQLAYA